MKQLKLWLVLGMLALLMALLPGRPAQAASLQIKPLMYREQFKQGEVKKGFVDVGNMSSGTLKLVVDIQGFKQIDNQGKLQFFRSTDLANAITPDFTKFELKPFEGIRLFFLIDGKKLPPGDNFAALFVRTDPSESSGVVSAVEVGSLLVIENGQPGPRKAEITKLNSNFFQFGRSVSGTVGVKNAANSQQLTAFFPQVMVSLGPVAKIQRNLEGPLVFLGITREVEFDLPTNRLGFYKLTVSTNGDSQEKWLFIVTGWWRPVAVLSILALTGLAGWWLKHKKTKNKRPL